jgi:hypothetical protein
LNRDVGYNGKTLHALTFDKLLEGGIPEEEGDCLCRKIPDVIPAMVADGAGVPEAYQKRERSIVYPNRPSQFRLELGHQRNVANKPEKKKFSVSSLERK